VNQSANPDAPNVGFRRFIDNGDGTTSNQDSYRQLPAGTTQAHLVGRYDAGKSEICVFVNYPSSTCSASAGALEPISAGLEIVRGNGFVGVVDEVAIYDYPLDNGRIEAHLFAGSGR
jgi:hypothetical protein